MGKVIRPFCWHQNFVPWGLSAPAPGLYTCIKSWKKLYEIRFLWNLQQMGKVIRPFCWHQTFACLPLPRGYIHTCIKSWKNLYKIRLQRDFFLNLQQVTKVTRCSCWHQNFIPKGLSVPAPGLYTCIKSWKILYKIRLQRDFFETCSKWPKWQSWHQNFVPWLCLPLTCG